VTPVEHLAAQTVHASWAPHVPCGHQTYGPDRDGQVDGHCCACEGDPCSEQLQMQRAADRRLLADARALGVTP